MIEKTIQLTDDLIAHLMSSRRADKAMSKEIEMWRKRFLYEKQKEYAKEEKDVPFVTLTAFLYTPSEQMDDPEHVFDSYLQDSE